MNARRIPVALVASTLLVAACGGSGDGAGDAGADATATAPDESVADTEPAVTEPVATEPADTDPPVSEPTSTEAPTTVVADEPDESTSPSTEATSSEPAETVAPESSGSVEPASVDDQGDGACLVGEWVVTQDELNAYYDAIESSFPAGAPAPAFDITGDVLLTFTESDYVYVADFDLALEVGGLGGTGDATGTVSGTWDVVDERVVTTLGSSDLRLEVTIGGTTVDSSSFANGILDSAPINDGEYDCAGPTITFQTGEETPGHDVLLTPA